jgi:hypothetical protein
MRLSALYAFLAAIKNARKNLLETVGLQQPTFGVVSDKAIELLHRDRAPPATGLALACLGRACVIPVAPPLPVRSVIAMPQAAQKQMPVSSVGPLTMRGAVSAGLRVLSSVRTASNSALSRWPVGLRRSRAVLRQIAI